MLTEENIEKTIAKEKYLSVGRKTTVCVLTLVNGFEVVGTSACVDPNSYDLSVGTTYARKKAVDKVWELEGYVHQVKEYEKKRDDLNAEILRRDVASKKVLKRQLDNI